MTEGRNLLWHGLSLITACVGYSLHSDIFWAIMDYIFFPLPWLKWGFEFFFN